MAELGETSDPVALVPGAPGDVDAVAAAFTAQSEELDATGRELHTFDPGGWSGNASERFREIFAPVPTRWYKTSDALVAAAGALTGYAETLRWAQAQAGEAIALWDEGQASTATALTAHQTALTEAHAAEQPAPTFSDPGEEQRAQARELLDRARTQLDEAGCDAAQVLSGNGPQGTEVSAYLTDVLVTGATSGSGGGSWGGNPWELTGPRGTASLDSGPGLGLGSAGNDFNIFSTGPGDPNRIDIGAGARAEASLNGEGLHATAEASAGATGHAESRWDVGGVEFSHELDAFAGGRAEANVDAGPTGVQAGVDAFAGGRVEYSYGAEGGGVSAGVNAEARAGIGASANVDLGYHDGRFVIDLDAGAAVGVGGEAGGRITVDPEAVADTIGQEADILDRNTDMITANDDHRGGFLNTLDRGADAIGNAVSSLF